MVGKYIRRCFGWEGTRKVEASEEGDFGRGSGEAGDVDASFSQRSPPDQQISIHG